MTDGLVQAFSAIAAGAGVGFSLGLIGGGGSILATPLLIYLVGVSSPHMALGTGALAVSVNAYANLVGHARKGHVRWRCAALFAAVGAVAAIGGSSLGMAVDGEKLLFLFGLLMLVVAGLMLRGRKAPQGGPPPAHICLRTGAVAGATGIASGFFGIGGGFLIVPGLMLATGMPMINAIGSSLLAVGTFGLATALNYARAGLVAWDIAGEFIAGGIAGGLLGMMAATRLASRGKALNRVFAGIVFTVGLYILYRSAPALIG